jgi:hypothetical protein
MRDLRSINEDHDSEYTANDNSHMRMFQESVYSNKESEAFGPFQGT